jgi:hypothetical protein
MSDLDVCGQNYKWEISRRVSRKMAKGVYKGSGGGHSKSSVVHFISTWQQQDDRKSQLPLFGGGGGQNKLESICDNGLVGWLVYAAKKAPPSS